jgi:glycosyltransferase involved in cell wall biosynthesis
MKLAIFHEMLVKMGGAERVFSALSTMWQGADLFTLVKQPECEREFLAGLSRPGAGLSRPGAGEPGDRGVKTRGPGAHGPKTCEPDSRPLNTSPLQRWTDLGIPPRFLLSKMAGAVESMDFSGYDTVITSSSAFAHGVKTGPNTRHICYCHSPMRYAWDYTHAYRKQFPEWLQPLIASMLHGIRQWDFRTANRPDILIANSEHVRKRIRKYWRREARVIYPPVDTDRMKAGRKHDGFFLIVSALTPFKRIDLAIRTFNKIRRRLVIIGDGSQRKALESIAHKNIEFLGYQPDDIVKEYYENCRALIFPGEEDFGITPVEAMAAGKPVLAFGKGGVTESVTAGVTGEFFNSPTPASLEDGLARLMANEKKYDPWVIREQAERFDRSVFESKMRELVDEPKKPME